MTPRPPVCCKDKVSLMVCRTSGCQGNPFLCGDQCECQLRHKLCDVRNWESVKALVISDKESQPRYKEIEQIFQKLLKAARQSYDLFKSNRSEKFTNQLETKFAEIVNAEGGRDQELSGDFVFKLLQETELDHYQVSMIRETHLKIQALINTLMSELEGVQYVPSLRIDSKITKDIKVLEGFFPKNVKRFKLLYRASDNGFDAKAFHTACDGVKDTLVLLQNEFGRVIGGYTPIPWVSSQIMTKEEDPTGSSFIFSVTHAEKLPLSKGPAVCHKATDGPVFGINDLKISGDATQPSRAAFNKQYNNANKYTDCQATYTLFTGKAQQGCSFQTKEWEVFQIQLV